MSSVTSIVDARSEMTSLSGCCTRYPGDVEHAPLSESRPVGCRASGTECSGPLDASVSLPRVAPISAPGPELRIACSLRRVWPKIDRSASGTVSCDWSRSIARARQWIMPCPRSRRGAWHTSGAAGIARRLARAARMPRNPRIERHNEPQRSDGRDEQKRGPAALPTSERIARLTGAVGNAIRPRLRRSERLASDAVTCLRTVH